MQYDLETGIHYVFLTLKGILGLSTLSTSGRSSHVAEFSDGVMRAVPRRGKGGVSRHENPNGCTNSHRHTNSNIKAAVDLQEVDPAILSIRFSDHMEADGCTKSEATLLLVDDSITATGRILGSSEQQPLKSHEHFSASISSAILSTINCSSAGFPAHGVDNEAEDVKFYSSSLLEEILLHQQAPSSPTHLGADAPIGITYEADSFSNTISNEEYIEEQIASSDDLGSVDSTNTCPEEANSLHILTDLVLKDAISPSPSNASASPSGDGANTPSKPSTKATSPTFSLPLDLVEDYAPEEKVSKTISALDLDVKASVLEPWHCSSLQWLDLAISDEQNYTNYTCERPQEIEEPEYAEEEQTGDVSPRISSSGEVENPVGLGDLDLDAIFGQSATDLNDEALSQEATVPAGEPVAENGIPAVETSNDYDPDVPEYHHLNLLGNPVHQASHTPSALSLWVTMASRKRAPMNNPVTLKAVLSSQATKWIDPVLIKEGVSIPEEIRKDGNATEYRDSLTGLTTIQYEPYGTWQSDIYSFEQEVPSVMDEDTREILDDAYNESWGHAGLQRPYRVDDYDQHHRSYSFPCPPMKQQRGWESLERRGDSNLRFVLNEDSITRWHAPAGTPTS